MKYNEPLIPGYYYHVYNRGNNRELLFYKHGNYIWFLKKFHEYLSPFLDTFAYSLLPNHFHFLVRVKSELRLSGEESIPSLQGMESIQTDQTYRAQASHPIQPMQVSQQFRKFFISYAQAINKQERRTGSLFQKNFKRSRVANEKYLLHLIFYIHANPQLHGLIRDFRDWPYSSYGKLMISRKSELMRDEVISWFGSTSEYKLFHAALRDIRKAKYVIE